MRTIGVSTEVFAAIWSHRRPGEETENAILERLLKLPRTEAASSSDADRSGGNQGGIYNTQFGVYWPPGFEIFRNYKGTNFRAVVRDGRWLMNGQFYPSLHKLSEKVVGGRENSWLNWKFRDENGFEQLINARRKAHP